MKLLLCAVLTFSILFPAELTAQKSQAEPRSNLVEIEPFQIKPGISFAASSPGTSVGVKSRGSAAERNRILADIREAEALIGDKYVDGNKVPLADLTKSALGTMLHTLDPHSNYFDRDEWKDLLDEQQSGYAGIGTSFSAFTQGSDSSTFILSTFPSSAARRAGLKFGDRIVTVNGVAVAGRSPESIREMIRGTIGSSVRMDIERTANGRIESIELKRGIIPQPSIPDAYMLRPGVGYIDLSDGFNYTTYDELSAALKDLHRQGMTSLVLDLRGNGGGIVDQAVKVAEKFLPSGSLIVSQRGRGVADSREWRSANPSPEVMPLVVVVDDHTASASEIVAGALQDSDRAIIVGQKTFGKGLVQNVIDLPYKSGLTLTAARYYTPTGRSIQRDYSTIGRYDYFNHRTPDSGIDVPYFEAKTITGRKVMSGDGIAPDVQVKTELMNATQAALDDPIFYFARDLVSGRIAVPSAKSSGGSSSEDLTVSDAMISKFAEYIDHGSFGRLRGETARSESRFVRLRLRYDLAIAHFGSVAAQKVLTDQDRQVEAAINAIPSAARLLELANKARHP